MQNALKEWLLGEEAAEYTSFQFEFSTGIGVPLAILMFAIVAVISIRFWWIRLKALPLPVRSGLVAMRTTAAIIILLLILGPSVNARKLQPSEHFVAVLLDDSASMKITGADGVSRADRLLDALQADTPALKERLAQTHQVAMYRFGETAERIYAFSDLAFEQRETDLLGAIKAVKRDLTGVNLAGVAVFSDGNQQGGISESFDEVLDDTVPVFTVGADTDAQWRDLELTGLSVARTNFDKSPVAVTIHASGSGLKGEAAAAEVLQGSRVVDSKAFTLTDDESEHSIRLEFVPVEKDWLSYRARVRLASAPPAAGTSPADSPMAPGKDHISDNNHRDFVVDNRDKVYRILYFAGRPNWENKFIRRALDDDPQLQLSSLIRISGPERKFEFRGRSSSLTNPLFEGFDSSRLTAPRYDEAVFIRLGLSEHELADGYPFDAEELYPFHLVIWGDIERGFFDQRHLELSREYVAKRGGALLLLGGPSAFSAGNYQGSVVESMLPVMLPQGGRQTYVDRPFHAVPSVEGFLSGIWSLAPEEEASRHYWRELPPLAGVNVFPMTRAGGSILARVDAEGGEGQPLFAMQRYGDGICAVMATGETWQWHLQTDEDNDAHAQFWRQLVRGLVKDAPDPVRLVSDVDQLTVAQSAVLEFLVRDPSYIEREGLSVSVTAVPESGVSAELPVEESLERAGVYYAEFLPGEPGRYLVRVSAATAQGETIGFLEQAVMVHPDHREYQGARFDGQLLRQVADHTHGAYLTLEQLSELPPLIPWPEGQSAVWRRIELWYWPGFFALIVLMWGIEWYVRRRHGHA